jgi:phosphoglucosamine mutase
MVNVRHENLSSVLNLPRVQKAVANVEDKLGKEGRLVLRKSGTEPVIRVMIETSNKNVAETLANELATIIRES